MDAALSEQAESRRSSAAVAGAAALAAGSGIAIPGRPLSKIRRGL